MLSIVEDVPRNTIPPAEEQEARRRLGHRADLLEKAAVLAKMASRGTVFEHGAVHILDALSDCESDLDFLRGLAQQAE